LSFVSHNGSEEKGTKRGTSEQRRGNILCNLRWKFNDIQIEGGEIVPRYVHVGTSNICSVSSQNQLGWAD